MKKRILIIILGLIVFLITTWAIFFTVDFINSKDGKPPLIVLKETEDEYEDGRVKEYYSLGYVLRIYDREVYTKNEITLSFIPQKFKYVSNGSVNDIADAIKDKSIVKKSFIKMVGKYNNYEQGYMQTYSYTVLVNEKLETEINLVFDENMIFECNNHLMNRITTELKIGDTYYLEGQIKKIKNNLIELDYCHLTIEE